MNQKQHKMSLARGDPISVLISDNRSNTKKLCVKYHENILYFSMYGAIYSKWA